MARVNIFEHKKVVVNRKKYILLAALTGWFGGHRFYAKQYPAAIAYLLFCWTGISLAMTFVDLLVAIPKPVNEQGCMEM